MSKPQELTLEHVCRRLCLLVPRQGRPCCARSSTVEQLLRWREVFPATYGWRV
ncbi:hypothetical protein NKH18_00535 [Streptomyces sp. M10(2022)]